MRACACVIFTPFFRAHLQFNKVLHQRQLALQNKFVILEPKRLWTEQNGGFNVGSVHQYMRTGNGLLHIITVDKMNGCTLMPSGISRWLKA